MNCPKCGGETESELQHSHFKADEVNDVSRCLNCGFEFYQVYRKHGKWREWDEHAGVSERYTNDMEPQTEEMGQTEYRLPHYSSTSVVYPSWYRESY
jgi:uncharacterized Zn finger protein